MKILVNSSIRDLDSKGMSLSAKAGAARSQEGGSHAVSKFRRAVRVKITKEDRKIGNMAAEFKRKKIVSECIYIKDILTVNIINLNVSKQEGIEDVWLTVQCRKLPSFIIGCVQRHPEAPSSTFDYLQDIHKTLSLKNKLLFVLGDFNDNLLNKDNKTYMEQ